MTPVQTLYRWFNDNPEATYKEALEAYEHCLELEQQLPQQEISDEEIEKWVASTPYYGHCTPEYREGLEEGAKWYREQLKQRQ